MTEREAWLFLLAARTITRARLLETLRRASRGHECLLALVEAYRRQYPTAAAAAAGKARCWKQALGARGVKVSGWGQGQYPEQIANALGDQAPPLLFLWGACDLLAAPSIGIAGARRPTPRGIRLARQAAAAFAQAGFVVVSGGAAGVDSAAHQAALAAGGRTIIVLPQGILNYALPAPWRPYLEKGSLLMLSATAPDAPWAAHAAIARNAVLSGLSQALCIIEPRKTGGSIRTARCGLKQGKPVFAAGEPPVCAPPQGLCECGAEALCGLDAQPRLGAVMQAAAACTACEALLF